MSISVPVGVNIRGSSDLGGMEIVVWSISGCEISKQTHFCV